MGREMKRVAIDFDWEIGKIWEGYINPFYKPCPDCTNGRTRNRIKFEELVGNFMHSSGIDEITTGLAGRSPSTVFGHDASDRWRAVDKIIIAAGLNPDDWGICPTCGGEAIAPDAIDECNAWTPHEPPIGDGYQLWETTTDGSPQSPVFASFDELCKWCEKNATTFASFTSTEKGWHDMLDDGFVHHTEGSCIFM